MSVSTFRLKEQLTPEYADRVAVLAEALARFLVGIPPSSSNASISNHVLNEKVRLPLMALLHTIMLCDCIL